MGKDLSKIEYLKALESTNLDYIKLRNSHAYLIGKKIDSFSYLGKKGKLYSIFKRIIQNFRLHFIPHIISSENYSKDEWKRHLNFGDANLKIAVYTCISGKYDFVKEPLISMPNCRFFLFTDQESTNENSVWETTVIPSNISALHDNSAINRYIKTHPFELFPNFDYAIYLDGNVRPVSDISVFVNNINAKSGMAFHKHRERECIYDEAKACLVMGKGNKKFIKKQINYYKKSGFPKKYGMVECNVFAVDLRNSIAKKILNEWWYEIVSSKSRRDQLSLPFVFWKNNIKITDVSSLGNNVYLDSKIRVERHIQ